VSNEVPVHPSPQGLGNAGKSLWAMIVNDLPDEGELDAREQTILRMACRQADLESQLDNALRKTGIMIRGAQGQEKMNPVVAELRNSRAALVRMLGELGLTDEVSQRVITAASRRAKRAADARWGNDLAAGRQEAMQGA
jgi:P27 family predicted phage terminase small subunit